MLYLKTAGASSLPGQNGISITVTAFYCHTFFLGLSVNLAFSSVLQVRNAADYRLRRHIPSGCDPDSCDYFMGVDTNSGNSSYLDFYLTGEIDGWVAVGFSLTQSMVRIFSRSRWNSMCE